MVLLLLAVSCEAAVDLVASGAWWSACWTRCVQYKEVYIEPRTAAAAEAVGIS